MLTFPENHDDYRIPDRVKACLQAGGGILDAHYHTAEMDAFERKLDSFALARHCVQHEIVAGTVFKVHQASTAGVAQMLNRWCAMSGLNYKAYGSITMNHFATGGYIPEHVLVASRALEPPKHLFLATISSVAELKRLDGNVEASKKAFWYPFVEWMMNKAGIELVRLSVLGDDGELFPQVVECLRYAGLGGMSVGTAHLSRDEVYKVVAKCKELSVTVVVTHALFPTENLTADEQAELAAMGAIIEHCFTTFHGNRSTWDECAKGIRTVQAKVGLNRVLVSSDLGQPKNPLVSFGLAFFAQKLMEDYGFTEAEIQQILCVTPRLVVGEELPRVA